MDGSWNLKIYLPAYPLNGDTVSFQAYATWSSILVGNLMGFVSLEMHTNDKLDVMQLKRKYLYIYSSKP